MTCLHCPRPVHGRGLCKMHYERLRAGEPLASAPIKAMRWDGLEAFQEAQRFRVERDPCFLCGVRGDRGCKHRMAA